MGNLEQEIKKVSVSIGTPKKRTQRRPPASSRPSPSMTEQKTYSLVPVQAAQNFPMRPQPRPSEQSLLRAYAESPWLHIKIARLASSFASIPFRVVTEDANGKETLVTRKHPLWFLMDHPNPMLSGWDFRFLTELYIRTVGSCYWRLRGSALRRELWVYPNNWVRPVYGPGRVLVAYDVVATLPGGPETERIPANQMLWLRIPDPLQPYSAGLGDALSLASEIDTFELASESDRRFFENDASPPGALVVPGRMEQGEVNRMKDDWNSKQGGPANQGNVAVLFGGMDFKTFRQGRREMDYLDGQTYLRDVIIAGVHKHVLGITDDVNFAAAKAADYQVSKWELAPRIPWWQDNASIVARAFDERLLLKWANPVPQDEELELMKSNEGLLRGAITRNEWRVANKYEPLPDDIGHVFIIPPGLIVVPADEAAERNATESPEKPPEPKPEGGAPEKTPIAIVNTGKPESALAVVAKQPMHADWRKIIQQVQDSIKTDVTMDVLKPVYEALMSSRLEDAKEELGVDVGLLLNDPTLQFYLRDVAGARIRRVDETTRDAVREQLALGSQAGESVKEIEDRLTHIFQIATTERAERIARTEVIDASNATAYAAYERSGVVEKVEWLLAPDYDHDEDDGLCVSLAEAGPVVIGMEFGDGIAWPPAHPNCRCAIAPVVEGADKEDEAVLEHRVIETIADESEKPDSIVAAAHVLEEFDESGKTLRGRRSLALDADIEAVRRLGRETNQAIDIGVESWINGESSGGPGDVFEQMAAAAHGENFVQSGGFTREQIRAAGTFWKEESQEALRGMAGNAEEITVYRGFSGAPGGTADRLIDAFTQAETVTIEPDKEIGATMQSWTVDLDVARQFAGLYDPDRPIHPRGIVVEARVRVSQTFGHAFTNGGWLRSEHFGEAEVIVRGPIDSQLVDVAKRKQGGRATVTLPADEMNWHKPGQRAVKPRRRSTVRYGRRRQEYIASLGKEHARLEKLMQSKMTRVFAQQRRAVLRSLRDAVRSEA